MLRVCTTAFSLKRMMVDFGDWPRGEVLLVFGMVARLVAVVCCWSWMGLVQPVAANRGRSWIFGRCGRLCLTPTE
ncbi:hypothetical protein BPORC_1909 [Bifidobacterium porcinum]|nr:hypothetical protein BPORC_1909 [Bifidobacterium porcinum]